MGSNEEVRDHGHLFQHKCPAVMDTALIPDTVSESMFKSSANCLDPFWDPAILGIQRTGDSSCMVVENEFVNSHYHNNHQATGISYNMGEMMHSFGSGNFSADMIGSYNMDESVSHSSFPLNQGPHLHPHNSPFGKRKRKNVEVGRQQKDLQSQDISDCPKEQPEKQIKDANSTGVGAAPELSKENYIHVRAKRGQATNSHSLAERVRREKISERMKMLQELVPGCNKITGKAVMLDEIINYVQSLQQQVEFLSMKLATVNPELNADIENMLSKDILQSRPGNTGRISLGTSSSHPFPGLPLGTIQSFPGTVPPFHSIPQNLWNNELHSVLQMGYDSNPSSVSSLGTNGLSKMEK